MTIIKSKARMFGDSINSQELIEALKNPLLKKDAPVQISTKFYSGLLKMIYKCPHCNKLHFVCGKLEKERYLEAIIHTIVFADHCNDGKFVTKEELISVLQQLEEVTNITLEDSIDDHTYTLTKVFKCSGECPVVHLDCAYEKNSPHLN